MDLCGSASRAGLIVAINCPSFRNISIFTVNSGADAVVCVVFVLLYYFQKCAIRIYVIWNRRNSFVANL